MADYDDCPLCKHPWHGLRCEKQVLDLRTLPYICKCPPMWSASSRKTDVESA